MNLLRRIQELRAIYSRAGIRVASGMYEVFSTKPEDLQVWKQVPDLEEAVQLAKYLVEQHDGSIINVWHPQEGQLYQIENQGGGKIEELLTPPDRPQKNKEAPPVAPIDSRPWDEQMGDYWQKTAEQVDMGLEGVFWLRLGDQGDYESYDSIQELVEELQYYDTELVVGPVTDWIQYGFLTPEFKGNNYISLYFGDENADPVRELSPREKYTVEQTLEGVSPVYAAPKILVDGIAYRPVAIPNGLPEGLEGAIRDAVLYYDEAIATQRGRHPDSLKEIVNLRMKTEDLLDLVRSGRTDFSADEVNEFTKAVKNAISYLEGFHRQLNRNPEAMQGIHDKRRRLEDLLKKVQRMQPRQAAAPVPDVGYDGFIGTDDPKQYIDKGAPVPEWVLEHRRDESLETIPEVTDEDVVKVHG